LQRLLADGVGIPEQLGVHTGRLPGDDA
jgi:hypothetical protein